MKKYILYFAFLLSFASWGLPSITGLGNITEPTWGLVGLPACGNIPGDEFTFTGNNLSLGDNFMILNGDVILVFVTTLPSNSNIFKFELPNTSLAGTSSNWQLTGDMAINENPSNFTITVLSCPTTPFPVLEIEIGQSIDFIGNDLHLVTNVTATITATSENFSLPFFYNAFILPQPTLSVQIPPTPSLSGQNLLFQFTSDIGGTPYDVAFEQQITVTLPISPPVITTVIGNIFASGGALTIEAQNIANRTINVNIGGIVTQLSPIFDSFSVSMPTDGRLINPYISVTDNATSKSDTWYFAPLLTFVGNGSLDGSNFDDFVTTSITSTFSQVMPIEYQSQSGNLIGLIAYDAINNNLSLFDVGNPSTSGYPLSINHPSIANIPLSGATSFKLKDITGDGFPEVFATNGSNIQVFQIIENGSLIEFLPLPNITFGDLPRKFDIGDVNNDGFNDAVSLFSGGTSTLGEVSFGNQNGSFSPVTSPITVSGSPGSVYDISIADMDNNGTNEILICYTNGSFLNVISTFSFTGSGYTENSFDTGRDGTFSIKSLKIVDLNNDGLLDVALSCQVGSTDPARFLHFLQTQASGFTGTGGDLTLPLNTINDIKFLNGDGDDKIDFIISGTNASSEDKTFLYQNSGNSIDGTGNPIRTFTGIELTTTGETFSSFGIADLNGDGGQDIIAANVTSSGFTIFKNNQPCITPTSTGLTILPFSEGQLLAYDFGYSGAAPLSAFSWLVSLPGSGGFVPLTYAILDPLTTLTGTIPAENFTKVVENLFLLPTPPPANYFTELLFNNLPASFDGANFVATDVLNFCGETISGMNFSLFLNTVNSCNTISASNFTISGTDIPYSLGLKPTFEILEPIGYLEPATYNFFIEKAGVVSPIIVDGLNITLNSSGKGSNNLTKLRFEQIPIELSSANLFSVGSYCGGNFTVFGMNTITVNSCLPNALDIFSVGIPAPFCENSNVQFQPSNPNVTISNWQISTSTAGMFLNLSSTGIYRGTNSSILGVTTLLSSLSGKQIRFTYNLGCFSNPYVLQVNSLPRFTSQIQNPDPVCGSKGLIEIVAETVPNLNSPTYQWYKFNSSTSGVFVPLTSFSAPYGSVTTPFLSITDPDVTLDQTQYKLELSASCGQQTVTVSSNPVTIRVVDGPPTGLSTILTPSVCDGADVSKFYITALGANMEYVWEENTNGTWRQIIENGTHKPQFDTLFVIDANRTNFNNRTYRVSITSACYTGTGASVTSNQNATFAFYDRPVIQPKLSGNCVFGSSTLSVTPNSAFQRYKWTLTGGTKLVSTTDTLANYTLLLPNTYSVYVNGNVRCTAQSSYKFEFPAFTPATITREKTVKEDALVANDGASYQWYAYGRYITGAKNKKFIGNYNGKYNVKVKYDNSCEDISDTITISESNYIDILRAEAIVTDSSITFKYKNSEREASFSKILVSPNPTNDKFIASFSAKRRTQKLVSLIDLDGIIKIETEAIYKGLQQYEAEVNVSNLRSGIYLLRILDEDEIRWTKVVVF